MMLMMDPERVAALRGISRDWEDDGLLVEAPSPKTVIALCADWEAMHKIVVEVAKRPCAAPEVVARSLDGKLPTYERPCGKCLPCRAKKLVEGGK